MKGRVGVKEGGALQVGGVEGGRFGMRLKGGGFEGGASLWTSVQSKKSKMQ